jgi:hypothetical protein
MGILSSLIPQPYKIIAEIALVVIVVGGAFAYGYMKGNARSEAVIAEYGEKKSLLAQSINEVDFKVQDRIVTEYVDRVKIVEKEVSHNEEIATTVVPDKFILSNGWVYTHDIAASGGEADSRLSADANPSGVEANQALATITENYGICKEIRDNLIALQNVITQHNANVDAQNKKNGK